MYTYRDYTKDEAGLRETLRKLAQTGYRSVQISKPPFLSTDN